MSGTHATDGLQSATETYTFQVVPEPSTAIFCMMGAVGLTLRRHRKRRAPVLP